MKARVRSFWHLVHWQLAEARQQRVVGALAAAAVLVVASTSVLRTFNFGGEEARFFAQVARSVGWLAGTLMTALVAPVLVQGGSGRGVTAALVARGVSRRAWVLAGLVALWTVLAWLTLLVAAALAATLTWHGHAGGWAAGVELAGDLGALLAIAAAAVLFATIFRQPTPAALTSIGFAVAVALAPIVDRMAERSHGSARLLWTLLDWAVPNFAAMGGAPGATLAYAAAYAIAAGLVVTQREL